MSREKFLKRIALVRRDLGNLLFHFTRSVPADDGFLSGQTAKGKSARNVLDEILESGTLIGSTGMMMHKQKCVCFTEAPISEMVSLFNLATMTGENEEKPRYEPYGIGVGKRWLFEQGGRPVIYQPKEEYDLLPPELQYRHVSYRPGGPDFTWEREWRIATGALTLDPKETLVIVPDSDTAFDMRMNHAKVVYSYDASGNADDMYHDPKWTVVSLDLSLGS